MRNPSSVDRLACGARGAGSALGCSTAGSRVRGDDRNTQRVAVAGARNSVRVPAAMVLLLGVAGGFTASAGVGLINIEFRPDIQSIAVGETAFVGVYLVGARDDEAFSAAQIVFEWNNTALQLTGLTNAGGVPLLSSSFPANDVTGYNETVPPQDGDGTYLALAPLGVQTFATVRGTLLTTFLFTGLAPGTLTLVEPIHADGDTKVVSGIVPGLIVTGTLTGAVVEVVCSRVFADLNCDGIVDGADLGLLLTAWGSDNELADLNDDGIVDGADLGLLLTAWG